MISTPLNMGFHFLVQNSWWKGECSRSAIRRWAPSRRQFWEGPKRVRCRARLGPLGWCQVAPWWWKKALEEAWGWRCWTWLGPCWALRSLWRCSWRLLPIFWPRILRPWPRPQPQRVLASLSSILWSSPSTIWFIQPYASQQSLKQTVHSISKIGWYHAQCFMAFACSTFYQDLVSR